MTFHESSYARHQQQLRNRLSDIADLNARERFEGYERTLDAWRHQRMMAPLSALTQQAAWTWLTVGDGSGWDAARLCNMGVSRVVATDLFSGHLELAARDGLIDDFSQENAEALSFSDSSFDVVLCKESFHHFPRPYIALYEMLRVASKAVVLIEPRDWIIDHGKKRIIGPLGVISHLIDWLRNRIFGNLSTVPAKEMYLLGDRAAYEESGNFIYSTSSREFEKVALGLNLPSIAFAAVNDLYEPGLHNHKPSEDDPEFQRVTRELGAADRRTESGIGGSSLLLTAIFKTSPPTETVERMSRSGWYFKELDRNPYLRRD
jgi:ubiquinone/menaquinone biosynthesis C-methylase UbiE